MSSTDPASSPAVVPLSDADYHRLSDRVLAAIERQADRWLQEGVVDIDPQRTGGLLELALPNGSKVVVNKQPPLQEIWLAARLGGFHFKWSGRDWRDTKDQAEFFQRLSEQLSAQAGVPLSLRDDGAA